MKTLPKAMLYAKRMSGKTSPLAVLLLDREVRVLRTLSTWYNPVMCCAFCALPTLAYEAAMSVRTCQRALKSLEVRGIVRRLAAETVRDDSQTSNEFEFPELGRVDMNDKAQLAERKRVFTLPRKRKTSKQLELISEQVPASVDSAGVVEDVSMTEDSVEALASDDSARMKMKALSVDSAACGNDVVKSPARCHEVTAGVSPCHPIELYGEVNDDEDEPISSLADAHEVQKLPEHRNAKATTNATANAKTGAGEAPRVYAERVRRERLPRRPRDRDEGRARGYQVRDVREGLDGLDAAVWDVVSDVLRSCAIAPERCTRKLREALDAALRLRVETASGSSLQDAGLLAADRLREFRGLGYRLQVRWSLAVFFSDGHWLHPQTWK